MSILKGVLDLVSWGELLAQQLVCILTLHLFSCSEIEPGEIVLGNGTVEALLLLSFSPDTSVRGNSILATGIERIEPPCAC